MILKEKYQENQPKKHNRKTFCPWVTHKEPPGEAQTKTFNTQNEPDIIPIVLQWNIKEISTKKHKGNTICPRVTLKDPPGEAQMKTNLTHIVAYIIPMLLNEKYQ